MPLLLQSLKTQTAVAMEPKRSEDGGCACASHAGHALKHRQLKRQNSNGSNVDLNGGRPRKRICSKANKKWLISSRKN